MFCAARPRSNAIDRGAFGRVRVGRDQRDRGGRPGDVPGGRTDRGQRLEMGPVAAHDERPALQVLAAPRAPARAQDPVEVVGLERPVLERADGPDRRDRRPDRARPARMSSVARRRAGDPGRPGDRGRVGVRSRRPCRPRERDLGERPQAADRLVDGARSRASASGSRAAGVAAASSAAVDGSNGPPSARARKPATAAPIAGILVQPRVLAAGDDAGSRPAPRSGRLPWPSAAAAASRRMWLRGTTVSSSPCASRTGPA